MGSKPNIRHSHSPSPSGNAPRSRKSFVFFSTSLEGASPSSRMARGHQKAQSQAKAQEKAAKMKKQQGHNANEQKKAAEVALKSKCSICMAQMPDPKTYKQHFENKHPKAALPAELQTI